MEQITGNNINILLISTLLITLALIVYLIIKLRNTEKSVSSNIEQGFSEIRDEFVSLIGKNNSYQNDTLKLIINSLSQQLKENNSVQTEKINALVSQLEMLRKSNLDIFQSFDKMQNKLLNDTNHKLDEIRNTVDEKLNTTLEKRLGQTFQAVSEGLEKVYKSIGEIQSASTDIADIKNVLTNVKTRGIWGEAQLNNLVEQILSPQQYSTNVETIKNSGKRVELAVKVPEASSENGFVWLPVDAKFPIEDYLKLTNSAQGSAEDTKSYHKALEQRIKTEAKTIFEKYIEPPYTTDFGFMFIPVEGLYAEILRIENLQEYIMRNYRIIITGPVNFAAILSSLRLGFRTFAIERRTHEIWNVLLEIKHDFSKFGDLLEKTEQKLEQASRSISEANKKTRQISGKLNFVEELPDKK